MASSIGNWIKSLCTPALVYFGFSMFALLLVLFHNLGNSNSYHLGSWFSCKVPSTLLVISLKGLYIVFWTYVLNLICKNGHPMLSWVLVLMPWCLILACMFLIIINK